jgi:DNA-binding transcriptional LysR family regulator
MPRPSASRLQNALIAVNAWGDGATAFLTRLRDKGIDDWRIRECADAATALTLARDHHHVAFVARSAVRLRDKQLREISMPGLSNWTIRLDLLHRPRDRDDVAIRALVDAVNSA